MVTCTFVALWLVTAAFYWTFLIIPAIFLAGIVAPAGRQVIAIGFLGEEMEVSEVRGGGPPGHRRRLPLVGEEMEVSERGEMMVLGE